MTNCPPGIEDLNLLKEVSMSKTIVLEIEDAEYERLLHDAQAEGRKVEDLAAQRLRQHSVAPNDNEDSKTFDANGWPAGFFEETYGSLASNPLQRLPQGTLETREEI